MEKRSYLLSQAKEVNPAYSTTQWVFNESLQFNTIANEHKEITPVCLISSIITGSKTEAFPGDDDPDPDAEFCF
ncbi:hypothetical protein EP073_04515 [Geovibrio thiophilus]|uniref:Uncharacterized protein n=1 Tax=Geovibrio thiophilus TaxID=139438 RepID=A0A3R5XWB3_9BACT|nr:hypothetical protein [Geovibrio thiophilus]QAR32696.1 hypothetical protein EP073_04515 [Geovibrio thiophilus]